MLIFISILYNKTKLNEICPDTRYQIKYINPGKSPELRGFTLIELLVVIAVLGILAVGLITIINPLGQMAKTRDSIRKSDLRQIANALEAYLVANGSYPNPTCNVPTTDWTSSGSLPWLQDLINSGDIKIAPKDPRNNDATAEYHYYYKAGASSGSDYCIFLAFEAAPTTSDPNFQGRWNNSNKYFYGPDGTKTGYECTHSAPPCP